MEDVREKSSVMNFKVKAGFVGQPQYLFEDVPNVFDEERIDE